VILGVSRSKMSDDEFRSRVLHDAGFVDCESEDKAKVKDFADRLFYQAIDTNNSDDYGMVKERMETLAAEFKTGDDAIFYLSTPPVLYDKIPRFLADHGLHRATDGYRRLVVEKPFGTSLASAKELNKSLLKYFPEDEIYRIDHYLGKETVQNLLITRFAVLDREAGTTTSLVRCETCCKIT